ncbi:MAG: hypothetical protein M1834_003680 [Cirrosporium novae-zelandiae]|nr:MAG: hypothetical protein M1834_003680 [Cirrosporium novae-zelandiae]
MPLPHNPIAQLLSTRTTIILDGALATELESRGLDLNDPIWSAKALISNPSVIRAVHLDYFLAGADVAITASYQATPLGLQQHLGLSAQESETLIRKSVVLAQEARDEALKLLEAENLESGCSPNSNKTLLIAGSVGPYGAYLANGSEYRGDYILSAENMKAFHRPRINALTAGGIDLLACETLPSFPEIVALISLLQEEFPSVPAWFSFTLKDASHISDGTNLEEVVKRLDGVEQVVAIGINCVEGQLGVRAVAEVKRWTRKPVVLYPNSGGEWDPVRG